VSATQTLVLQLIECLD
jgi:signal recognition particle GTPase